MQHHAANRGTAPEKPLARSGSSAATQGVTESTWKTSHPHPESPASLSRTNSEVSLYIPVRRRSVLQTPGVATRPQQTSPKVPAKSSFRNSVPSTPSLSRRTSIESVKPRRMSLPAVHIDLPSQFRVSTPSEAEYKQLGGMKFGTLRITNGAPELTPRPEVDEGTQASISQSAVPGYFDRVESTHAVSGADVREVDGERFQMLSKNIRNSKPSTGEEEVMHLPGQPTRKIEQVAALSGQKDVKVSGKSQTVGSSSSTPPSRATSKSSTSDSQSFKKTGERLECLGAEKSDLRGSTAAVRKPERLHLELEHKVVRTLSMSDSGVVPSPSSETSRKALSKSDSGYSSNLSLQSLQTTRSGVSERSYKTATGISAGVARSKSCGKPSIPDIPQEIRTNLHHRSKSELPRRPPSPPPIDPSSPVPVRRPSFSSLARDAIRRFPTLRSSKSRDCNSARSETTSSSQVGAVAPVKQSSSNPVSQDGDNASQRRQGLPERDPRTDLTEVQRMHSNGPSFQTRVADEKDMHKIPRKRSNSASHRYITPRNRSSKDTLRTILSVGSTEMLQTYESSEVESQQEPVDEKASIASTPRRRSLHSVSHSFAQRTAGLLHSKKSSEKKALLVEAPSKDAPPEASRGSGIRSSNIDGNGGCTGKSAAVARDRASLPAEKLECRRALSKSHSMEGRGHKQISPLKTQRSAPNVNRQGEWPLSPSYPEFSHLQKSRTPPPVSMRTRNSKNLRPVTPNRSWSAPPAQIPTLPRLPLPHETSQDAINSYKLARNSNPSPRTPTSPTSNSQARTRQPSSPRADLEERSKPQPSMQGSPRRKSNTPGQEALRSSRTMHPGTAVPYPNFSYGPSALPIHHRSRSTGQLASSSHPSKHSPQLPLKEVQNMNRQHHRSHGASTKPVQTHSRHGSNSSAGSQYRVLHSYDSPAYRGVPTRG